MATGIEDTANQTLDHVVDAYNDEHDEAPRGLEQSTIDIWPDAT